MNHSLQRQRQVHQAETDATKDLFQKDAQELQSVVDQKRKVNEELNERLKQLREKFEESAKENEMRLSSLRRSSLGEIQSLQLELFNLRRKSSVASSIQPEPKDYGPFTEMMCESFQGDYLRMEDVPAVLHTMFDHGKPSHSHWWFPQTHTNTTFRF